MSTSNPDWLASSRSCFDRNEDNWMKTTRSSIFRYEWKERDGFVAICMCLCDMFSEQWGYPSLLECSWEGACKERRV